MKKIIYTLIAMAMIAITSSCEKVIPFNGEYSGEKLVLYSFIHPGDSLSAKVFKSRFFLASGYDESYWQPIEASVEFEVNGQVYPATKYTDPDPSHNPNVTYVSSYKAKPGDKITVRAAKHGFASVSGSTVVPEAPNVTIDSVYVKKMPVKPDTFFQEFQLHFRITVDDPAELDYYALSALRTESNEYGTYSYDDALYSTDVIFASGATDNILDAFEDILGTDISLDSPVPATFDDAAFNGEKYTFDVWYKYFNYLFDDNYYASTMAEGQDEPAVPDISINISKLSKDAFLYKRSYDAKVNNDDFGSIFGEPVAVHNNIENGIGCVCAISSVKIR